jgi:hypothetical protein
MQRRRIAGPGTQITRCETQGKIERWHQTMKNRVLLEKYCLPGDLECQIGAFVDYYNNQLKHESLNIITPAGVYFGRDSTIIREREKIKKLAIQKPPLARSKADCTINHANEPDPPKIKPL